MEHMRTNGEIASELIILSSAQVKRFNAACSKLVLAETRDNLNPEADIDEEALASEVDQKSDENIESIAGLVTEHEDNAMDIVGGKPKGKRPPRQ